MAEHEAKPEPPHRLNPIARTLLEGIYDENSELSKLQGIWHILSQIWRYVTNYWRSNIKFSSCSVDDLGRTYDPEPAFLLLTSNEVDNDDNLIFIEEWYIKQDALVFPKSSGIQINMMPFVMQKDNFEGCLLPDYLKKYWKNIIRNCPLEPEQIGKIGYLTIQESFVEKDQSQRRPGLHTERPGVVRFKMETEKDDSQGGACADEAISDESKDSGNFGVGHFLLKRHCFRWGFGNVIRTYERHNIDGGIYMASNVKDSCRIYNCKIINDDLIGEHGDIEHLRDFLPEGEILQENALYWFTDRTPHESLPLKTSTNRQFFRLVTSDVSVWYEDHSTKNPLGVVPDPEKTKIIKGSKFDKAGVVFSEDQSSPAKKKGMKNRFKKLFSK